MSLDDLHKKKPPLAKISHAVVDFDSVEIVLRGVDANGKNRVNRFRYKPAPLTSVSLSAFRPVKQKGKKLFPSEFTFFQVNFITS